MVWHVDSAPTIPVWPAIRSSEPNNEKPSFARGHGGHFSLCADSERRMEAQCVSLKTYTRKMESRARIALAYADLQTTALGCSANGT